MPGHFPKDANGLARFDGTALYEHEDWRKGEHKEWGTYVFNYGRKEDVYKRQRLKCWQKKNHALL